MTATAKCHECGGVIEFLKNKWVHVNHKSKTDMLAEKFTKEIIEKKNEVGELLSGDILPILKRMANSTAL